MVAFVNVFVCHFKLLIKHCFLCVMEVTTLFPISRQLASAFTGCTIPYI